MTRLSVVLLLGCNSTPTAPIVAVPPVESVKPAPAETVVWLLDQPKHGGYESTCYAFAPNGTVTRSAVVSRETGTVALGADGPKCSFGDRWDPSLVGGFRIELRCSDGKARTLTLDLTNPSHPEVRDVDSEPGWSHRDFDWRLRTCGSGGAAPSPKCCASG